MAWPGDGGDGTGVSVMIAVQICGYRACASCAVMLCLVSLDSGPIRDRSALSLRDLAELLYAYVRPVDISSVKPHGILGKA